MTASPYRHGGPSCLLHALLLALLLVLTTGPVRIAQAADRWSPSLKDQPVATKPAFDLVVNSQPRATIVIAADALDSNKQAADLLQTSIRKISGATLPIVDDSQPVNGPVVLIGRSKLVDALKLDIPSGYTRALQEEGYLIKMMGQQDNAKLVLVGNDHRPKPAYHGSLLAVVEILQRLGCRWYMPGDFGAVYPASEDVSLPALDLQVKPDFAVRGFWYGAASTLRKDKNLREEMTTWQTLNRFLPYGSVLPSAGDGSIMAPFRQFKTTEVDGKSVRVNEFFDEHPELFALNKDGTRNSHYICLSTPEVLQRTLAYADEYFQKNPDSLAFAIAPPDGAPTCECPDCRAKNDYFMQKEPSNPQTQDISGGFYWFLNEVAKHIEAKYPDKWVTTTAYSGRIRPPENLKLNDNITLHTALLAHSRHHQYDSPTWQTQERITLYKRWTALSPNIVEREYYPVFQFHLNLPQPMYRASAYNYRLIKSLGMRGAEWESRTAFMAQGANDYIRGQLLWNTQTDIDALLDDYYTRFYGQAGKTVRRFDEAVEDALTHSMVDHHEEERIHEIYPHDFVVKVTDAASDVQDRVAKADDATRRHVDYFRQVVDHFRAYSDMREAEAQLDFKQAAALAQKMIDIEAQVTQISLTFIDSTNIALDSRPVYGEMGANGSAQGKLKQYLAKARLIDGTQGKLVTALPVSWQFKTDSYNDGLYAQWYLPAQQKSGWRKMDTTSSWEIQGLQDEHAHGYDGFAWYTTTFDLPAVSAERKLTLFLGGVNNQAWVWINGQLAGAMPYHQYWARWQYQQEIDISDYVKPGQANRIAIRVWNDQDAGGIFRRCFIYAPVSARAETR